MDNNTLYKCSNCGWEGYKDQVELITYFDSLRDEYVQNWVCLKCLEEWYPYLM